ncbi:ATP-binding protein [uncultured Corynebacterium sp.]|uniref:ATP-binding protein n=1 Tax=uncultured Corynebacterium sp. TaxID=159447 RepID=UPI0028894777|nr:ATP-binding protein [uncultured Corynebacterium sp.]
MRKNAPQESTEKRKWWQPRKKDATAKAAELLDARRLDYRYAQDDPFLFIKGESVWTGVILSTTSDEYAAGEEQIAAVQRNVQIYGDLSTHFVNAYKEDDVTIQTITRFAPVNANQWQENYLKNCWDPTKLFASLIENKVRPHLEETAPERRQYLLVRLGDFKAPRQVDPLTQILGRSAGVAEEVFNEKDLSKFRKRARETCAILTQHGASLMYRNDLNWLIQKALYGHFPVNNVTGINRTRPWRGGWFDEIVNISADIEDDYVRVKNPHPENGWGEYSYITTLTVEYPDPTVPFEYSGAWGRLLKTMPRPVDVIWPATILSAEKWRRLAKKLTKNVLDEANVRQEVGAQHSESFDRKWEAAETLKHEHEIGAKPVLVHQQRLTFAAASPEELTKITTDIISMFGESARVRRPIGDQGYLLEDQLPGDMTPPKGRRGQLPPSVGRLFMSNFNQSIDVEDEQWSDLEALAYARLDSSTLVGDAVEFRGGQPISWQGMQIGYTLDTGTAVHFDPLVQMARNRGAGIVIIGASGGGKSSLALTLFFWVSESGTQTIVIDPKNDFEAFVYYLSFGNQVNLPGFTEEAQAGILGGPDSKFRPTNPQFWADTAIVSLGNGAPGALDPWAIAGGTGDSAYMQGENLARDVMNLVFLEKDDRKILNTAFQNMRDQHLNHPGVSEPSLSELAQHLGAEIELNEKALEDPKTTPSDAIRVREELRSIRSVQDQLVRAETRQLGRLMFGKSRAREPFRIGNKRRTIITLLGTSPPSQNTPVSEWDENTRDTAAAMLIVLREIERMMGKTTRVQNPRGNLHGYPPRSLWVDEFYFVAAIRAGRVLLDRLARQGRSLYFSLVLISQQARDLNALDEDQSSDEDASVNQFATRFVFLQAGLSEANDALSLLKPTAMKNLTDMERNAMAMRLMSPGDGGTLLPGQCVMRDVDGRVATIAVDRLFREIEAATQTNPRVRSQAQSEPVSADGTEWTVHTELRDRLRTGMITSEIGSIREAINDARDESAEFDEYASVLSV